MRKKKRLKEEEKLPVILKNNSGQSFNKMGLIQKINDFVSLRFHYFDS